MTPDDITRLAERVEAISTGLTEAERRVKTAGIAADLRTLAQQQSAANLAPGVMHCAKCEFRLHRVTLYMGDGTTGAGDSKTEPCPNGCGPLWPVTWEQEAREAMALANSMHEQLQAAQQQGKAGGVQIIGWIYEDRLPAGYPYDAMFPHSKVDGVRLFPVFAPPPAAQHEGSAAERTGTVADISDEELLRRAVFNLARPGRRSPREFAWTRIMDVFGLGSTYSTQLCRRFERDPDTGKPIAPQPKDAT